MFPEWSLSTCLLCNQKASDSYEHMIPDSLGGTLEVKMLCHKCNNVLGSRIIGTIKKDLMIRLAIGNLKDDIPDLYNRFEEGLPYAGVTSKGDRIPFKRKGKSFSPKYTRLENAEILDTRDARRQIRKQLKKEGATASEIEQAMEKMSKMDGDKPIAITDSIHVAKPPLEKFDIQYSHEDVHASFPLLVSYEFLGLVIGKSIYDGYFDAVRSSLAAGKECEFAKVERFRANTNGYRPIHTIMQRNAPSDTIIDLILFDWIWYRTTFSNLRVHTPNFVYRDILTERRVEVAESAEDDADVRFTNIKWTKYPPNYTKEIL